MQGEGVEIKIIFALVSVINLHFSSFVKITNSAHHSFSNSKTVPIFAFHRDGEDGGGGGADDDDDDDDDGDDAEMPKLIPEAQVKKEMCLDTGAPDPEPFKWVVRTRRDTNIFTVLYIISMIWCSLWV